MITRPPSSRSRPPYHAALALLSLLTVVSAAAALVADGPSIFGFAPSSLDAQRRVESQFLRLPSEARVREFHRYLTAEPHMAGSARNKHLAEWQREAWLAWGLEDVHIVTHEVLLPWPERVKVEMIAPRPWTASLAEDRVEGDPYTWQDPGIPYHAYSASGEITGEVVYAGAGNPENYDWLEAQGIALRGKIALVRYSVPYSYRGFKALTAERRGLAGLLIYSDPAEDGFRKGRVYPDGPWGNESHIQRGGIPYDFLVPGDPLTPGWASVSGARRIARSEAVSLPSIVSVPLSARDARVILDALRGPLTPPSWQGGLPIPYHAGPGPARLRLDVRLDDRIREVQTVVGRIRGSQYPEQDIILGNHRDAWVFGGVDPSSGSASLMELARGLGALLRDGVRPKRSIVLASWDAEEFTLTSSTEWGEQFAGDLDRRAVAYINVDSSSSGPDFTASAVPSLNRVVEEAARDVRAPSTRQSVAAAARTRAARERGAHPDASGTGFVDNKLGSGSDYTVFLNHLGVPIIDMSFEGPYGVYHSIYDNHQWVARIGDPGFRHHTAMTRLLGLVALRLANADILPFDHTTYARRLGEFTGEVERRWLAAGQAAHAETSPFASVHAAVRRLDAAARSASARRERVLSSGTVAERDALNAAFLRVERAFLDARGIPGRPWFRHLVYAPKFTYAPEVLPGPAEALEARDEGRLVDQCLRLAAAIDRAAAILAP